MKLLHKRHNIEFGHQKMYTRLLELRVMTADDKNQAASVIEMVKWRSLKTKRFKRL